jgi:hypothetical protein
MGMKSLRCSVRQTAVTVVTDLEGEITKVICPEYERATGLCKIRAAALRGGALSQLLDRLAASSLDRRAARCDLH